MRLSANAACRRLGISHSTVGATVGATVGTKIARASMSSDDAPRAGRVFLTGGCARQPLDELAKQVEPDPEVLSKIPLNTGLCRLGEQAAWSIRDNPTWGETKRPNDRVRGLHRLGVELKKGIWALIRRTRWACQAAPRRPTHRLLPVAADAPLLSRRMPHGPPGLGRALRACLGLRGGGRPWLRPPLGERRCLPPAGGRVAGPETPTGTSLSLRAKG